MPDFLNVKFFQYFNQFSLFLPTDDDDSGESKSHRSRLDPDAWTDDDPEMQKAASMASALVLFFPQLC